MMTEEEATQVFKKFAKQYADRQDVFELDPQFLEAERVLGGRFGERCQTLWNEVRSNG